MEDDAWPHKTSSTTDSTERDRTDTGHCTDKNMCDIDINSSSEPSSNKLYEIYILEVFIASSINVFFILN